MTRLPGPQVAAKDVAAANHNADLNTSTVQFEHLIGDEVERSRVETKVLVAGHRGAAQFEQNT